MYDMKSLLPASARAAKAALLFMLALAALCLALCANPGQALAEERAAGQLDIVQADIDAVGKQTRGGQCLVYSYAYATTITTGEVHHWNEFSGGGVSAKWIPDLIDYQTHATEQETLQAVYDGLAAGHPVVLHLMMNHGGQHWVTVTGFAGSDSADLQLSDFLALDSVEGIADDGPEPISEETYRLYLTSNNVRVCKATTTWVPELTAEAVAAQSAEMAADGAAGAVGQAAGQAADQAVDGEQADDQDEAAKRGLAVQQTLQVRSADDALMLLATAA